MHDEQSTQSILDGLETQFGLLWGEEDARQQSAALRETAEQLATVRQHMVAIDIEPRFF